MSLILQIASNKVKNGVLQNQNVQLKDKTAQPASWQEDRKPNIFGKPQESVLFPKYQ